MQGFFLKPVSAPGCSACGGRAVIEMRWVEFDNVRLCKKCLKRAHILLGNARRREGVK